MTVIVPITRPPAGLFATGIALVQPAPVKPAAGLWTPLQFLLGDWVGEGGGAPGQSAGGFSFQTT